MPIVSQFSVRKTPAYSKFSGNALPKYDESVYLAARFHCCCVCESGSFGYSLQRSNKTASCDPFLCKRPKWTSAWSSYQDTEIDAKRALQGAFDRIGLPDIYNATSARLYPGGLLLWWTVRMDRAGGPNLRHRVRAENGCVSEYQHSR